MKNNMKFLTIVSSIIIASALLLAACMQAITTGEESSEYNPEEMPSIASENPRIDETNGMISLDALKTKFDSMKSFNKDSNTVTVITDTALLDYWKGSDYSTSYKSLSPAEVNYIIQDSINLYYAYDKIAVPMPPEGSIVDYYVFNGHKADSGLLQTVYKIILTRLEALSSYTAFYKNTESELTVYVPNVSEETDFEILKTIYSGIDRISFDSSALPEHYTFYQPINFNRTAIMHMTKSGATQVFPTDEMVNVNVSALTTEMGFEGPCITLDLLNGSFTSSGSIYMSLAISGDIEVLGDELILYLNGRENTVTLKFVDNKFICQTDSSWFKKDTVFFTESKPFMNQILDYMKKNDES